MTLIKTAPKDGTRILLFYHDWCTGSWRDDGLGSKEAQKLSETWRDDWGGKIYPTWWMPLPAAPGVPKPNVGHGGLSMKNEMEELLYELLSEQEAIAPGLVRGLYRAWSQAVEEIGRLKNQLEMEKLATKNALDRVRERDEFVLTPVHHKVLSLLLTDQHRGNNGTVAIEIERMCELTTYGTLSTLEQLVRHAYVLTPARYDGFYTLTSKGKAAAK